MNVLVSIQTEISGVLAKVAPSQMQTLCDEILSAKCIFVDGEGRSGFSAKGFAMRLMHLGFSVYFIGETITPAMQAGDLFVGVSGSGTSPYVLSDAAKAKNAGCRLAAISSTANSALCVQSDAALIIPGTVKADAGAERKSMQLLSSLFDQCLHITLDGICLMLSRQAETDNAAATSKHF